MHLSLFVVFFFQAEDGIRDRTVTGVQTCALPIFALCPAAAGGVAEAATAKPGMAPAAGRISRNPRQRPGETASLIEVPWPGSDASHSRAGAPGMSGPSYRSA